MKTRFLILFLMSMALCACNATRRAERRIRRIVERCPELLSEQAHPIDTLLAIAPVTDSAAMPLLPLLIGEVVTVTTSQGTFTASATTDTLTITYDAELEPIHYVDTVYTPQVVIEEPPPEKKKPPAFMWFLLGMVIVLLAVIVTAIVIVIKMVKAS